MKEWLKNTFTQILLCFLLLVSFFMICYQQELKRKEKLLSEICKENAKLQEECIDNQTKLVKLSNNFGVLFRLINNPKLNNGHGIVATYDLQYKGLPTEEVAGLTDINFEFINY